MPNKFSNTTISTSDRDALHGLGLSDNATGLFDDMRDSFQHALCRVVDQQPLTDAVPYTPNQWRTFWRRLGKGEMLKIMEFDPTNTALVTGDLNLFAEGAFKELPPMVYKVLGIYKVNYSGITSFRNSPQIILGGVYVHHCKNLKSFVGLDSTLLEGGIYISDCSNLTSLKGLPPIVKGNMQVSFNRRLTSLAHLPRRIYGDLDLCDHDFVDFPEETVVDGTVTVLSTQTELIRSLQERTMSLKII